ncbi:MAG: dihydropteroate synthase [bacterium]|nr:dihydropteroate synthase [bacterium]MCY4104527.1 dihydropteroate synthase [bacterium]
METKVMGVLRLAPDMFADNGRSLTRAAVTSGRRMISEGADIVEIACTPRAGPPPAEQVANVVEALAGDARVALATASPTLAAAATAAGATLICDHSMLPGAAPGGTREALAGVAAEAGAGWVAVHTAAPVPVTDGEPGGSQSRGGSPSGRRRSGGGSPSGGRPALVEALESLEAQGERAGAAGLSEIYLDPGIGCGRSREQDLDLLGGLERLAALGRPLVVGTGDGGLIDELHAAADTRRVPVPDAAAERDADRLEGALVVAVWAMLAGAAVLRTRHVAATVEAARIVGARRPVGAP